MSLINCEIIIILTLHANHDNSTETGPTTFAISDTKFLCSSY